MKKILIFRPGALGDILLSFPLLEILKFHKFEIYFVSNAEYISLIHFFNLGKGISFDHSLFIPIFLDELDSKSLKNFLEQFDFIFCIEKNETIYTRLKKIHKFVYFINSIPPYLIPIRLYLIKEISKILNLNDSYTLTKMKINKMNKNTNFTNFLIHPGSGSRSKIWNIENFYAILEFLLHKSKTITILEGPAESGISEEFKNFKNYIKILKTNNIYSVIDVIHKNDFYIGNDSGITHLSAYLGISGIAIFGVTNPWLWNPLPSISCFYELKPNGEIRFPSLKTVYNYLESVIL
ncbi:MAG: glycosyltransferase family 9 protein [Leptonema sp. (in: bacteria)]